MDTILYHYCPTSSFHAIVESGVIWLSSLSLSNDSSEGLLSEESMVRLANRDEIGLHSIDEIRNQMRAFNRFHDGLGFCLSRQGDILSQWRGYADNGSGVAMGFSRDYLDWLSATLKAENEGKSFDVRDVYYKDEDHDRIVRPAYQAVKRTIEDGAFTIDIRGIHDDRDDAEIEKSQREKAAATALAGLMLLPQMYERFCLKPSAFHEECEVRLLAHRFVTPSTTSADLYRADGQRIIPYREFKLGGQPQRNPIVEVILGPRHETPASVVAAFLLDRGFDHVQVAKSTATYR